MIDTRIFTTGGTVQASGGVYIARPVDDEFLRLCQAGVYSYALTARQMGKSSLMVRTADELAKSGTRTVILDLTRFGANLDADQWYLGLIDEITEQLDLDIDYVEWWKERAHLGPTQRLDQFIRRVMLEQIKDPIVIFIDEIDSTLKLAFTDDFFAAVRAAYNARANDPEYRRLTFVLLGVARPSDLIKDRMRTPYNIGVKVDLQDFKFEELSVFRSALETAFPGQGDDVLHWILDWTGGQPYLTQKLCAALVEEADGPVTAADVEAVVTRLFLGLEAKKESNLETIQNRVRSSVYLRGMMPIYRRVLNGQAVPDDERSIEQSELKLAGLVRSNSNGTLEVRNKLYARIFNAVWIKANTPVDWARRIAIGASALAALAIVAAIIVAATASATSVPVINTFNVLPAEVAPGDRVTIEWNVSGANKVELISPNQETLSASGTKSFVIIQSSDFVLRAANGNGASMRTASVQIKGTSPVITFFRAEPDMVVAGEAGKIVLSWSVVGADSVFIDNTAVPVTLNDPKAGSPSLPVDIPITTTTYTLKAINAVGTATATATVSVDIPGCRLNRALPLREGPSDQYPPLANVTLVSRGERVTPFERTEIGDWVRVRFDAFDPPHNVGWLPVVDLTCSVNALVFPVSTSIPPLPTATSPAPSVPTPQSQSSSQTDKIVFYSLRDGNREIYVMNADGSTQTRLTNDPASDRSPVWSPDGNRIAFVTERDAGSPHIYVMNADGSQPMRLSNGPGNDDSPSWSPDGSRIAFASTRDGRSKIYVMNVDGSNVVRLTDTPNADDVVPAWSPDGTRIAFYSNRDGNREIYVMNADGSQQTRLTFNSAEDAVPAWSPDGTHLAFESMRDGNREIYLMLADGSNQTRLTDNPADDTVPAWSPDGSQLVFASNRDGRHQLYLMQHDGALQTRLTNSPSDDFAPAWLPRPSAFQPAQ